MVRLNGVDYRLALLILTGNVNADIYMRTFNFMIQRFANVVQQAGTACGGGVKPKLRGHNTGQVGNLKRMVQNILAVASAVTQPPQKLNQFGMNSIDAGLNDGALTLLLNRRLHLTAGFINCFLNAGGVNTSIRDQALQRNAGHLAAHGFKAGKRDGLRRVVNDKVYAGHRFNRTDIAALTADDAALHFVVGKRNNGDGGLRHMVGCTALNGHGDNLAGGFLSVVTGLLLKLHHFNGLFMGQFVFQLLKQVVLCLIGSKTGNAFQHFKLAFFDGLRLVETFLRLFYLVGQRLVLGFKTFKLFVECFFFLLNTAFLPLDFPAAVVQLTFAFVA